MHMQRTPPMHTVPRTPPTWSGTADAWPWHGLPALSAFVCIDGSGPAHYATTTRWCYDEWALYVRFDCHDPDIWATYTQRDDPLYDEEVVELFIAPGSTQPTHYYELEINPNGVIFDARIDNSSGVRAALGVDTRWNPALYCVAHRDDPAQHWSVTLAVPWAEIAPPGPLPQVWRANCYRIERSRGAATEYSAWSPTLAVPADFHVPAHFGVFVLDEQRYYTSSGTIQ